MIGMPRTNSVDIDSIHGLILSGLRNLHLGEFKGIDLSKTLYNESYYSLIRSKASICKLAISTILTESPVLTYNTRGYNLLMVTYDYQRNDHKTYWNEILGLFDEYDEIFIKDSIAWKDRLKVRGLVSKIGKLIKFFSKLVFVDSFFVRLYLASRMTAQYIVLRKIINNSHNYKVALCLYDGGFCESIIMSYLKLNGCITLTNQHGQPLFRDRNSDRMNQSQILNVISDWFLAKGKFTQIQLDKAGYQTDRVKIVGDIMAKTKFQTPSRKYKAVFGVLLDCPTYSFAGMSNRRMIEFAKQVSKDLNIKYIIRSHPQEPPYKYKDLADENCVGLYGKERGLNDIFERIDFSLFHASAVYLDLLKSNIRGYQVDCGVEFPIVMNDNDVVHDVDELKEQIMSWQDMIPEERNSCIKGRLNDYIGYSGDVAKEMYRNTILHLLNI